MCIRDSQEPVGLMLDIGKRQAFLFRHSVAVPPNSISAMSSFTSLETAGIVRTIHSERQGSDVRHRSDVGTVAEASPGASKLFCIRVEGSQTVARGSQLDKSPASRRIPRRARSCGRCHFHRLECSPRIDPDQYRSAFQSYFCDTRQGWAPACHRSMHVGRVSPLDNVDD